MLNFNVIIEHAMKIITITCLIMNLIIIYLKVYKLENPETMHVLYESISANSFYMQYNRFQK